MASKLPSLEWRAQSQVNWSLFLLKGISRCILCCIGSLHGYARNRYLSDRMQQRCEKVTFVLWIFHKAIQDADEAIRNINKEKS